MEIKITMAITSNTRVVTNLKEAVTAVGTIASLSIALYLLLAKPQHADSQTNVDTTNKELSKTFVTREKLEDTLKLVDNKFEAVTREWNKEAARFNDEVKSINNKLDKLIERRP